MTTDQAPTTEPTPAPVKFDYEAWLVEEAERKAAFATEIDGLKTRLFDALASVGIVLVTVAFDGSGDSGQIEAILAFDSDGDVALPELDMPHTDSGQATFSGAAPAHTMTEAIETLAYDLLEYEHDGWEINEGAYGEFRFDVAERTITLDCHMRIETTEYSEASW